MRGASLSALESDDDAWDHPFASAPRPSQEQPMETEEDSRLPFDLVKIYVEGHQQYSIDLNVDHGRPWIEVNEVTERLQIFLDFTPRHWLIREEREFNQGGGYVWRLPHRILSIPPNKVIHVKVELYPPASQQGPIPVMMGGGSQYAGDSPDRSMGRRLGGLPPLSDEMAESGPPEEISQYLPPDAGIGPSGSYLPDTSALPGVSLSSMGMDGVPATVRLSKSMDAGVVQASIEAFRDFCFADMPNLTLRTVVDIGKAPWSLIGWTNDPSHALRDPCRVWTFTGPLRYKATAASATWRRNHKTDQAPDCLTGSRWRNRNRNKKGQRVSPMGVEIETEIRYFFWDAGTTAAGSEVEQRWRHWKWILHEELPNVRVEQVAGNSCPDIMGHFTLMLREAKQRPSEVSTRDTGRQTTMRGQGNFPSVPLHDPTMGLEDTHRSLGDAAGFHNFDHGPHGGLVPMTSASAAHDSWQEDDDEDSDCCQSDDSDGEDDDTIPDESLPNEIWPASSTTAALSSKMQEMNVTGTHGMDARRQASATARASAEFSAMMLSAMHHQSKRESTLVVVRGTSSDKSGMSSSSPGTAATAAAAEDWVMLKKNTGMPPPELGKGAAAPSVYSEMAASQRQKPVGHDIMTHEPLSQSPADKSPRTAIHQFSLAELKAATDNFHSQYLEDGMAETFISYTGTLSPAHKVSSSCAGTPPVTAATQPQGHSSSSSSAGIAISIKWLRSPLPHETFEKILDSLRLTTGHPNLEEFLGYVWEGSNQILVFTRPEGEWLSTILHGTGATPKIPPPSWMTRCLIALNIAKALDFLHERCNIVHENLRPDYILLETNGNVRIRNWSLPGVSMAGATGVVKSDDQMAQREYYNMEGHQTQGDRTSDIMALGAIILETLSGSKAYDSSRGRMAEIHNWAHSCLRHKKLETFIDSRAQPLTKSELAMAAHLVPAALSCTLPERHRRPTAAQVWNRIRSVITATGVQVPLHP